MESDTAETVAFMKRKLRHASHYSNCFDRDRYESVRNFVSMG